MDLNSHQYYATAFGEPWAEVDTENSPRLADSGKPACSHQKTLAQVVAEDTENYQVQCTSVLSIDNKPCWRIVFQSCVQSIKSVCVDSVQLDQV